jgi:hypothetical protein
MDSILRGFIRATWAIYRRFGGSISKLETKAVALALR